MKIKLSYKTRDELPKGMEELYDEVDGEFKLTGVEGMKSQDDIVRIQTSLVNERKDHKATKDKLKAITDVLPEGVTPEQLVEKLDSIEELEAKAAAAGKDKPDEDAINRIVETRVKRALAPIERERDQLKKQVGDLSTERDTLSSERTRTKIEGAVGKVAQELKVVGTAIDDVMLRAGNLFEIDEAGRVVTKEGVDGVAPGLDPKAWLTDMQEKASHWWAASVGGGANGSKGGGALNGNPFSAKNWNLTEQGNYVKQHGMEKAQQLAKQAGTTVGGPRPAAA
jgi:hypothetical protein